MNQTTDVPQPPPNPEPPPGGDTFDRVGSRLKTLRRSRSDRVVAGVCGGVARGLGLDPLFMRVLVAVLALVGGAGVLLYALGWLLLPEDDGRRSVAERAATGPRQPGSGRPIVLAVVLLVVALVAVSSVFHRWDGPLLLALAVVGLVLWIDRRADRLPPAPLPAPGDGPTAGAGASSTPSDTVPLTEGASAGGPPSDSPPQGWTQPLAPPPPAPPARPRSVLFAVTMFGVLVALGVLGIADAAGGHVATGAYPALALAVVGAGLVVGAWRGRSRGLIVVGLLLSLVTAASVGIDRAGLSDRQTDVTVRPRSVAELPTSASYRVGSATYDLRALSFPGSAPSVRLSIGAGEIVVIVPRDVDVTVQAHAGLGQTTLFGQDSGGPGVNSTVTDLGADGVGGGALDLTLEAGVGHLEVRRG